MLMLWSFLDYVGIMDGQMAHNVWRNTAVVFAAQNDAPKGATK